jgi:hypothetical protein
VTTQAQLSERAYRQRHVNILTAKLRQAGAGTMYRLKLEKEIERQRKKIAGLGIKE